MITQLPYAQDLRHSIAAVDMSEARYTRLERAINYAAVGPFTTKLYSSRAYDGIAHNRRNWKMGKDRNQVGLRRATVGRFELGRHYLCTLPSP